MLSILIFRCIIVYKQHYATPLTLIITSFSKYICHSKVVINYIYIYQYYKYMGPKQYINS